MHTSIKFQKTFFLLYLRPQETETSDVWLWQGNKSRIAVTKDKIRKHISNKWHRNGFFLLITFFRSQSISIAIFWMAMFAFEERQHLSIVWEVGGVRGVRSGQVDPNIPATRTHTHSPAAQYQSYRSGWKLIGSGSQEKKIINIRIRTCLISNRSISF